MSNIQAFFPTGARCKIKVNGVTLAYATDLEYRVSVPHNEFNILGSYEADAIEPTGYHVTGSFTVIRYIEGETKRIKSPSGASEYGNGIGSFSPNLSTGASIAANSVGLPGDGRANQSLDPSKLQEATGFDIEIYMKISPEKMKIIDVLNPISFSETALGLVDKFSDYSGIARIRGARIIGASATLTKRGLLMQRFEFIGQFLDEDSFIAGESRSF